MITVYGLKNCDTCRKALKWLEAEGIAHEFRDLRADGFDEEDVRRWLAAAGRIKPGRRSRRRREDIRGAGPASASEGRKSEPLLQEAYRLRRIAGPGLGSGPRCRARAGV